MTSAKKIASFRHLVLTFLLALAAGVSVAQAQNGPPQFVRDAVEATIEMLSSEDANAAEAYVDEVMTAVAPDQRAEIVAQLAAIRVALGGPPDAVDVEPRIGGVILAMSGVAGRHMLTLDVTPEGVTQIGWSQSEGETEHAATDRDGRAEQHLRALEEIHRANWEEFVSNHLAAAYRASASAADLERLRAQLVHAAAHSGGAGIDVRGDVYNLTLNGPERRWTFSFTLEDQPPFGIRTIEVNDADAGLSIPEITRNNLDEVLAMAAQAGLDGVVYVKIDGEELARAALGFADRNLGRPMEIDQIFGVGSQPIDYTVPLALIAEAEGHLSLDDPISRYVGETPADRAGMTVRHLVENMSGLPDFVDNQDDWDADLSWITRDELIRRILAAPLRFPPGERRGHSHAGFTLLAAIVEIATGRSYYELLREKILDPAGMAHTGMYGDRMEFAVEDFAVGGGPSFVGLPNIPPNWGPTSWLVMGSGGMYSTLNDIVRLTRFLQTSERMPVAVRALFSGEAVNFNGSVRGFEMFEYRDGTDTLILIFSNSPMGDETYRDLARRLEQFGSSSRR